MDSSTTTLEQTDTEQSYEKYAEHNSDYDEMTSRFNHIQNKFRGGEYPTSHDLKYLLFKLGDTWQSLETDQEKNMYRDIRAVLLCYVDAKAKNPDKPRDWDFNSGYELLERVGMPSFELTEESKDKLIKNQKRVLERSAADKILLEKMK